MNKVLIIGYVWLERTSGAGTRMFQIIELLLAHDFEITFASAAQKTLNTFDLTSIGVSEVKIELNSSSFDRFILELQPNIVFFDRFMIEEQFGWRVAEKVPDAIRVLDTEDLHSLRKARYECLKKETPFSFDTLLTSELAKREISAILRSDLSLIISSFEMTLLQDFFSIDENLLVHLPFLVPKIDQQMINQWPSYKQRKDFVFVGNFLHKPNVDAVLELKKLWKQIRSKLPQANICIYGAYPSQQIQQLHNEKEGFLVKGYVDDVLQVVQNAKLVLAPLRFGAGIKGKLIEAMLCGTPSVTTQIGAEGMCFGMPWNGKITTLEDFAQASVDLYTNSDLWCALQNNGIQIVNQLYNKKQRGKIFIDTLVHFQNNSSDYRRKNFIGSVLRNRYHNASKYMSKWIELKNQ